MTNWSSTVTPSLWVISIEYSPNNTAFTKAVSAVTEVQDKRPVVVQQAAGAIILTKKTNKKTGCSTSVSNCTYQKLILSKLYNVWEEWNGRKLLPQLVTELKSVMTQLIPQAYIWSYLIKVHTLYAHVYTQRWHQVTLIKGLFSNSQFYFFKWYGENEAKGFFKKNKKKKNELCGWPSQVFI